MSAQALLSLYGALILGHLCFLHVYDLGVGIWIEDVRIMGFYRSAETAR